jgi:hypothetical protein
MSALSHEKTYHYSAQGHGLSGHFVRPIERLIEVQAASSLPTIGGHGNSRVSNFRFQEFVSFSSGYSHVSGSQNHKDGAHTTLVTATIEGLNILDVVTADRIVARLSSQHPSPGDEPNVVFVGSKFENLQIGGCPVKVEFNQDFVNRLDTFKAIRTELETNSQFRKIADDNFQVGERQKIPDENGVLHCSLVKNIETDCPGVTRRGHCLIVPQFGKIFLAEVLAYKGTRTLTMVRLELGSPVSGSATVAEANVNGRPWP